MSLLDVRLSPLRTKLIKDWESDSEPEEVKQEVETLPVPEPVKMTTLEQFYEQRKSKMNPVNIMLSTRK